MGAWLDKEFTPFSSRSITVHIDSYYGNGGGLNEIEVIVALASTPDKGNLQASCDIRIIAVSDGAGIANASGEAASNKLDVLAKGLAGKLKEGMVVKSESIAVVSLRNRSGTSQGKVIADELADKVQGSLIDTGWFDVKERIDLRAILDEKDLDTAGIVKNENVRKKLAGVKYIVIGGVTVTEGGK